MGWADGYLWEAVMLEQKMLIGHVTIERLEARTMMSVSAADPLSREALYEAFTQHTLSPEQMDYLHIRSITWEGREIYADSTRWLVNFKRPRVVDPEEEWNPADYYMSPEDASVLRETIEGWNIGATLEAPRGSRYSIVISTPADVDPQALAGFAPQLKDFSSVCPNVMLMMAPMEQITIVDPTAPPVTDSDAAVVPTDVAPWGAHESKAQSTFELGPQELLVSEDTLLA